LAGAAVGARVGVLVGTGTGAFVGATTGDAIGETIVGDACGATTVGDDPIPMGAACGATADGDAFGVIALGGTFGADRGDDLGATTIGCGCGAMATGATGANSLPGKGRRTLRAPFPCANLMGLPL
jgi:hypothetical protein